MAGIYIHIPFCRQACHYCNFHFSTTFESYRQQMVDAICQEIQLRSNFFGNNKTIIQSIYFGGGTPSILSEKEFYQIWDTLAANFDISKVREVTLEANPDDMDNQFFDFLKASKVDRLSIGIQSFDNSDLTYLNRVHNSDKAIKSIETALSCGIDKITADLLFGIPTSGIDRLEKDVKTLTQLGVNHISIYGLTVEPKTALEYLIRKEKVLPVDDDRYAEEMLWLMKLLPSLGYEQYEISSFAIPGFEAVHNSSYWHDISYLGIGPSAHSYNNAIRSWNIENNMAYIRSLEKGVFPSESETLDTITHFNEWIMTKLRLREGVILSELLKEFGADIYGQFKSNAQPYIFSGDIITQQDSYVLSLNGKLLADHITANLFL